MNNIVEEIRIERKRQKMTQETLSEKSGINRIQISLLESGKRNPKLETLEKIVFALGCEITIMRIK